jgi:hypothetical protein
MHRDNIDRTDDRRAPRTRARRSRGTRGARRFMVDRVVHRRGRVVIGYEAGSPRGLRRGIARRPPHRRRPIPLSLGRHEQFDAGATERRGDGGDYGRPAELAVGRSPTASPTNRPTSFNDSTPRFTPNSPARPQPPTRPMRNWPRPPVRPAPRTPPSTASTVAATPASSRDWRNPEASVPHPPCESTARTISSARRMPWLPRSTRSLESDPVNGAAATVSRGTPSRQALG